MVGFVDITVKPLYALLVHMGEMIDQAKETGSGEGTSVATQVPG